MREIFAAIGLLVVAASVGVAAAVWLVHGTAQPPQASGHEEIARLKKEIGDLRNEIRSGREQARVFRRSPPGRAGAVVNDLSIPSADEWIDELMAEEPAAAPPSSGAPAAGGARPPVGGPPPSAPESRWESRQRERREEARKFQVRLREEYVQALQLNDAQVGEIEKAYGQAAQARSDLRAQVRAGQVKILDALAQAEEIRRGRDQEIERTLYPDQFKKFQELEQKLRQARWIGGSFRGPFESSGR